MRERDLQTLEFDKVLSLLADCALSSAGREASLALRPQTAAERVEAESERARQFFEKQRLLQEELTEARLLVRRLSQEGRALITNLHDRAGVTPAERHEAREKLAQFIHQQEEALKTREQSPPPAHSPDHCSAESGSGISVLRNTGQ